MRMILRRYSYLPVAFACLAGLFAQPATSQTAFTVDARTPAPAPETNYLEMGSSHAGKSPDGHTIGVNSRYLVLDGKPWLPVMGEFHYTRYPERYWEEEILKMKAGGIQIISTYIFWIHHEEIEGQFDWSGQRDLRHFVQLCAKHGMYVYPRIGPWDHGEVRNGGFPDWLLKKGPTRVNEPVYLSYVRRLYGEVEKQLRGLLWHDGGPVIGIQLENEYANRAANGGAAYISKLKSLAVEVGLDVPLYTVTGWDNAVYPAHEVIPVFGGYPDEPWSGSLQQLPPDTQKVYQFHLAPNSGAAGILQGTSQKAGEEDHTQILHYPRFTVELGAGLQVTYHRRVVLNENDITPMALSALGSGVNMLGYYMFQGGENPEGKLSTLQESQATGYPNDVPVKSYDFQAPLRAFGQMNDSFRKLKVIHQFLNAFGSALAPMRAVLPDKLPSGPKDTSTLRLAARSDGEHGFLFFNNYLRNYPLPEHKGFQVTLKLSRETLAIPREPVNIPSQTAFIWPVNLDLGGVLLKYATAQPFAKLNDGAVKYYFFTPSPGIAPEFSFSEPSIASIKSERGNILRRENCIFVFGMSSSTDVAMEMKTPAGSVIRIVLLSGKQAEDSWLLSMGGKEHLLITLADVYSDDGVVHLRARNSNAFAFSVLPETGPLHGSTRIEMSGADGAFTLYAASVKSSQVQVTTTKVRDPGPSAPIKMGPYVDWRHTAVAEAPADTEFERAATWRLDFPGSDWKNYEDVFLDVAYVGDVARIYSGEALLDDDFFDGTAWELGLKRFSPHVLVSGLVIKILPLRKDAPIYLPTKFWPDFKGKSELAILNSVSAEIEYEVTLSPNASPHSK